MNDRSIAHACADARLWLRSSILLATLALPGCKGVDRLLEGTAGAVPRLGMSLQQNPVTVSQGSEFSMSVTVWRTGEFSGDVTMTVDDVPEGTTATISPPTTNGNTTSATLTFRVGVSAKVGSHSLTVRSRAPQFTDASLPLLLYVTDQPAYALSLSRSAVTIARGGITPLSVKVARTNLSSPITVSLTGAAGISAELSANPVTGDSAEATISVEPAMAPGTYNLSVRGATPGLADRSAPLTVTVVADPVQVVMGTGVSVVQGSTATADIIVNRASYSGAITLSAENLPAEMTAMFAASNQAGTRYTMTLVASAAAAPGSYAAVVRAKGTDVPDATTGFTATVNPGSLALSLAQTSVIAYQGGSISTALTVARTGFTGPLAVAVEGLPPTAGLTASANPSTMDGAGSTVTVSASASAIVGDYPVGIRVTPEGAAPSASHIVTLTVSVRSAPSAAGNVLLDWSTCGTPEWFAFQDGSGAWTRALPTAGVFRFTVLSARAGFAWAEGGTTVFVRFMTQQELTAKPLDMCVYPSATKTISGVGAHAGNVTEEFVYSLGGGIAVSTFASPSFSIVGVRQGVHDLVAWSSSTVNAGLRGLIRRDVDLPDRGSLGTVSMTGAESYAPERATLSVTGVSGGNQVSHRMAYLTTAACTENPLNAFSQSITTTIPIITQTLLGVPETVQRPTDLHLLTVTAAGGQLSRSTSVTFRTLANKSVAMHAGIAAPLRTTLSGDYKRFQASAGNIPVAYNGSSTFEYNDGRKTMSVSATIAYTGLTAVVLAMPDFSAVNGWSSAFAIATDARGTWKLTLAGASSPGSQCVEGRTTILSSQSGVF